MKTKKPQPRQKRSFDPLPVLVGIFLATIPLVVSVTGFDKFRFPKDVYFYAGTWLLLAVALAFRTRPPVLRFDRWNLALGLGAGFLFLHSIVLGNPAETLPGLRAVLTFFLLYALIRSVCTEGFQARVWLAAGLSLSVNAAMTVLQSLGWFSLMEGAGGRELGGRLTPAGFLGEVNSGGFLFGLICVIALYFVTGPSKGKVRLVWVAILFMNLAGLLFTRTLTSMIALVVAAALWLVFFSWWSLRVRQYPIRRLASFGAGLLVVLLLGGALAVQSGVSGRVQWVLERAQGGALLLATAGRYPVYQMTARMIQERPVQGWGLNSFGREFFRYKVDTDFGQETVLIDQPGAFQQTHNEYLQVWQELGILGLLLFAFLLWEPLWGLVNAIRTREDPAEKYWAGVLGLGIVYVSVVCLAHFPFHVSSSAAFIALLLACCRATASREEDWVVSPGTWLRETWTRLWGQFWIRAALAIVLGAFSVRTAVNWWTANQEMGLSVFLLEQSRMRQLNDLQLRRVAEQALKKLERCSELGPDWPEIENLRGTAYMTLGSYDRAQESFSRAASRIPSPELYTNMAAAHLAAGERSAAREDLQTALRYNPSYEIAEKALERLK